MSKREEARQELARKLDAGEISQGTYDARMARMKARGKVSQERHHAANAGPAVPKKEVEEWSPGGDGERRLDRHSFAMALRFHRERLGLTQQEMASLLEVSDRAYWQWESESGATLAVTMEGVIARLKRSRAKKRE